MTRKKTPLLLFLAILALAGIVLAVLVRMLTTTPAAAVSGAPAATAVAVAPAPDGRTLERGLEHYRSAQKMSAGPKPGRWLVDAETQNGPTRLDGHFLAPQFFTAADGVHYALTAFVADTVDAQGDGMDSFAASGQVRTLLFADQAGDFVLKDSRTLTAGTQGMAPGVRLVRLGEQAWGWQISNGWTHMGYSRENVEFFAARDGHIVPMGELVTSASDAGTCPDASNCPVSTELTASWRLVPEAGKPFYSLEVDWSGRLRGQAIQRKMTLQPDAATLRYPVPKAFNISF
ncbi:hypothetical protein [Microvirgula aerodenitrificans]|uniref:hypothetical protein n=1 Tax=Microvirgula aerodenitrificans TaxID=57480 RepID=UPI00048FB6AB|nr:hypothetical protein [Microvirgula aerodenitrificans]